MSIIGVSGFRPTSPGNFLIHEGASFLGINMDKLRSELGFSVLDWSNAINPSNTWTSAAGNTVIPRLFGATRGGGKVDFNSPPKQIEGIDGVRGPVMGLDLRDNAEAMVTVTVLELHDGQTIEVALAAADKDEWSSFTEYTPRYNIEIGDYIPNIAFAQTVNDAGVVMPQICVVENCLVVNAINWQSKRGDASAIELQLRGSAPLDNPLAIPMHIFVPKKSGSGS